MAYDHAGRYLADPYYEPKHEHPLNADDQDKAAEEPKGKTRRATHK